METDLVSDENPRVSAAAGNGQRPKLISPPLKPKELGAKLIRIKLQKKRKKKNQKGGGRDFRAIREGKRFYFFDVMAGFCYATFYIQARFLFYFLQSHPFSLLSIIIKPFTYFTIICILTLLTKITVTEVVSWKRKR